MFWDFSLILQFLNQFSVIPAAKSREYTEYGIHRIQRITKIMLKIHDSNSRVLMIPVEIPSVIDSIQNQLRTPPELATQHKELPHIMLAEVAVSNRQYSSALHICLAWA